MPHFYDLHSHSTASDGTLTPTELLARAAAQGVGALALTDHDTTAGLAEGAEAAAAYGVRFVAGIEVSVTWRKALVHIVGLHIEPDCVPLQEGLDRLRECRNTRAVEMGRSLEGSGIPGAYEGACRHAGGAIVGRTHFARFLVEGGYARDVREVFERFLVPGRPGYVAAQWAGLEEAVSWIRAAGGQAVIAHPARYRMTATRLRELIGEFKECGGAGMEVVSGSHSREDCYGMATHARRSRLLASCGSDYHGPENPWVELGRLAALPAGCTPIWESWPGYADAPARASL
jgi:3',5'-nucleoside bisphosphate phosphatase